MHKLTDRQHTIFGKVVETHIDTAYPVGSKTITERYRLRYSPATVRNEMGVLEDIGFLTHTHISSGRVPTDSGYRYYINTSLSYDISYWGMMGQLEEDLWDISGESDLPETFIDNASWMLAEATREMSVVLFGQRDRQETGRFGRVRSFLKGSSHIFEKPEFQDISKIRSLFGVLEDGERLSSCIGDHESEKDVSVQIGKENAPEGLWDCSVVSSSVCPREEKLATLSLIGPRRMQYVQAIPLVRRLATAVEHILEERWFS